MGSSRQSEVESRTEQKTKTSDSFFEVLVPSLVGIGSALVVFAAARNSITWYVFCFSFIFFSYLNYS